MMEWMLMPLRRYADFNGRSQRMEYWMFVLFNLILSFVTGLADGFFGFTRNGGVGILSLILSLGLLIPSIAVGVRRMHDTNHSGWWLLVPIVNLVFAVSEGDAGPNRFGPDPKDAGGADVFS